MAKRVLILGSGVAGNALAGSLRRRGHDVYLIGPMRTDARGSIGEHLAPEALPLLQALGVEDLLQDRTHLRSPGVVSLWQGRMATKDYSFSLGGDGYNLDRTVFDTHLRLFADQVGVRLLDGVSLTAIRRAASSWIVELGSKRSSMRIEADLLVDASGRSATLARHLGARRRFLDNLIAVAGRYRGEDRGNARLIVESAGEGWWYAARQTQHRRIAVYITEPDGVAGSDRTALWYSKHSETELVRTLGPPEDATVAAWDARSMVLLPQGGAGWISIGDAAMAFDPLSAAGITKALADACAVASLVSDRGPIESEGLGRLLVDRGRRWRAYIAGLQASYGGLASDQGQWWAKRRRWATELDSVEPAGFSGPADGGNALADTSGARSH
ncbi:NAD(P)/FAD-dependent oxidoreductase [Mesorhizobium onobrychidis]|uniref:Tryptophan 7-halogenase n=1 Tax=Mesorhizobium onobrychidis TaxID=2775404 RepID=A0ABY5R9E2_9HYPH|nr:FAD-dependent monooxygenase [Mesorhizobium onobrychidis]UVC19421.1 tryptophan 7-halogenase [Mesorhizobium onobrychidis]